MASLEFDLKIVSPEGVFLESRASLLELRTGSGQIGVMAGHERLLTTLETGEVIVHRNGEREPFHALGGFVRVYPDHVLVLAYSIRRQAGPGEAELLNEQAMELV